MMNKSKHSTIQYHINMTVKQNSGYHGNTHTPCSLRRLATQAEFMDSNVSMLGLHTISSPSSSSVGEIEHITIQSPPPYSTLCTHNTHTHTRVISRAMVTEHLPVIREL